jgi:hypothetical protein
LASQYLDLAREDHMPHDYLWVEDIISLDCVTKTKIWLAGLYQSTELLTMWRICMSCLDMRIRNTWQRTSYQEGTCVNGVQEQDLCRRPEAISFKQMLLHLMEWQRWVLSYILFGILFKICVTLIFQCMFRKFRRKVTSRPCLCTGDGWRRHL